MSEGKYTLSELIGKRVLITERTFGYMFSPDIHEVKIIEVSPSGEYMCVEDVNGSISWHHKDDIIILEVLD